MPTRGLGVRLGTGKWGKEHEKGTFIEYLQADLMND